MATKLKVREVVEEDTPGWWNDEHRLVIYNKCCGKFKAVTGFCLDKIHLKGE